MSTPTKTPPPVLDVKTAKAVTPYRHEKGRTVSVHQPASEKQVHRFTATGIFVDTVAPKDAETAAEKSATEDKAARVAAQKANDEEHALRMKAAAPASTETPST